MCFPSRLVVGPRQSKDRMKSVPPERESLLILRNHRPRAFGSGQLPAQYAHVGARFSRSLISLTAVPS